MAERICSLKKRGSGNNNSIILSINTRTSSGTSASYYTTYIETFDNVSSYSIQISERRGDANVTGSLDTNTHKLTLTIKFSSSSYVIATVNIMQI